MTGTRESIIAAHVSFLGYLLVGYWKKESEGYDINWTTPFCVLTLRLTGLVMNVYDGVHCDKLKRDQKAEAIKKLPGLLEIAAFTFLYSGTFVGPQFTLAKFRSFVDGAWLDEKKQPKQSAISASLRRFLGGAAFLILNLVGTAWIPNSYFNTPEYYKQSFFWRWTWAVVWFRVVICRYCALWMIVEGSSILNGLGYNGQDQQGRDRWDGVRDIDVWKWEVGTDFTSCVQAFNRGTNTWVKNNILRRLRWLNNKSLAHLITLGYLAIWHGYHLGYFLIFGMEFGCMVAQEQLYSLVRRSPELSSLTSKPSLRPFLWLCGRLILLYSMGFAFLMFGLVKTKYWIGPVKSLYFIGYIFYFIIWPALYQVLLNVLPLKKKDPVGSPTRTDASRTEDALKKMS
nr:Membrane bound O-acyl transferase domain containing protein [Haemonchus contortus]